ncbi:MAG: nitroreductase family protein [Actinobacteria bacterium]|nr:MAG: nitroreductase family protein [Actinomycetota bacterium]
MTAPDVDTTATDHLLTTTRTVRKRLDLSRPVPASVILECLELASQAPTGGNLQRTRWVIVTDPDKRRAMGDLYKRAMDPYHAIMEPMAEAAGGGNEKVIASSRYLADVMGNAPVLVIPCELGTPADMTALLKAADYPHTLSDNVAGSGFYGSVWPSVWSLMLALRSRGLGSALTTMHLALEREAGELLGIPDTVTQIGLIPVAYYSGETFKPAKRRPVGELTYWNAWKDTTPPA